jgi:hypothetical protein
MLAQMDTGDNSGLVISGIVYLVVSIVSLIVVIGLIVAVFRIAKATESIKDEAVLTKAYLSRIDSNIQTICTAVQRAAAEEGLKHLTIRCQCGGLADVSADGKRAKCRTCDKVWVI